MAEGQEHLSEGQSAQRVRRRSWPFWLGVDRLATFVVLALGVVILWKELRPGAAPGAPSPLKVPRDTISFAQSLTAGDQNAPVILMVYSDFQCPFCGQFARNVLPELRKSHIDSGRVLVAFKNYPLERHARAFDAATAAECAGEQGRFWPMHDMLFREPSRLNEEHIVSHVIALKLDREAWQACREGNGKAKVQSDLDEATRLKLPSTPLFYIGRRVGGSDVKVHTVFSGTKPVAHFREALDRLLQASTE